MNIKREIPIEGRHPDVTSIGMAKQGKSSQPNSMSGSYFTRLKSAGLWFGAVIRLGWKLRNHPRGDWFPLYFHLSNLFIPTNRFTCEVNIFGYCIVFAVGLSVVPTEVMLKDMEDD